MEEEPERFDLKVFGEVIGTATGFDRMDTGVYVFYDPVVEGMPEGTTIAEVDLFEGGITFTDDSATCLGRWQVEILKGEQE